MRILLAAMVAMLLAVCAYAQPNTGNLSKGSGPQKEQPAYHVSDQDYKAALKRVPESKAKFDPWGGVRETPQAGKTAPKSKR
jgi:hypothetical protein